MWVDFSRVDMGPDWEQDLLATFSQQTRRNIRAGLSSNLTCFEAKDPDEIKAVFEVIETNGREQGYATRTWQEFGDTLISQVQQSQAIVLGARVGETLVGAHYGVLAGRRYSYIMGGTIRTGKNLKVGHFLHWMAILKGRELGLLGCDLTSAGTPGVNRFKMGFRPEVLKLMPAQELVFQRWRYAAWAKLLPSVQRHTRVLATLVGRRDNPDREQSDD